MAKRRRKSRKRPQQKIPILATLGVVGGLAPAGELLAQGNLTGAFSRITRAYTGWDPVNKTFDIKSLKDGWLPLLIGVGGSMLAAKAGVNRRLRLPFVKL